MRSEAVTVGVTPTLLSSGGTSSIPKSTAIQVPADGVNVFLGGPDVTTANGIALVPGAVFTIDLMGDEIHGVVATGTQAVRVMRRDG